MMMLFNSLIPFVRRDAVFATLTTVMTFLKKVSFQRGQRNFVECSRCAPMLVDMPKAGLAPLQVCLPWLDITAKPSSHVLCHRRNDPESPNLKMVILHFAMQAFVFIM